MTLLFFAGFLLTYSAIPGWWIWCAPSPHAWDQILNNKNSVLCALNNNAHSLCLCPLRSISSSVTRALFSVTVLSLSLTPAPSLCCPPLRYSYIDPLRYAWGALMVNQFSSCCPGTFLGSQTVLECVFGLLSSLLSSYLYAACHDSCHTGHPHWSPPLVHRFVTC